MKAKKIISLLLSFLMVLGIVPTFAIVASAENAAATVSNFKYYYYEDFEDFTTDMTTADIATALGWTNWDANVADLKIVETVWVREVNASVTSDNATLKSELAWNEGNNHEYANRNHRIVDVAVVEAIDAYKNLEFDTFKTYSKKLLVVPKVANQSLSIQLSSGITTDEKDLFVDMEFTPNKQTSLGWESGNTTIDYDNTSSVGYEIIFDTNDKYTQEFAVDGSISKMAVINGVTSIDNDVEWSSWYTANNASLYYGSGINLKGEYTYTNANDTTYIYDADSSANTLSFNSRIKMSESDPNTFVKSKYTRTWNASSYETTSLSSTWIALSDDDEKSAMSDIYNNASTASVNLKIKDSGMSFYLDDLIIADNNGTAGSPVEITLDNVKTLVAGGAKVDVADLTADGKQCIYATVNGNVKYAGETVTLTEGMTITTGSSIDIDTRYGASMRLSDPTGLRWTTDINLEDLKALNDDTNISNVKVGTLITLTDNLAETAWEELTVGENVVDVAADLTALKAETADSNGNVCFNGSVVNIKSDNLEKEFSGIGYISMTVNGETVVIYGNYSAEAHSRNVHDLAQAALADVLTDEEKAAHAEGNKYTEALVAGDKYVVIDGDNVTIETFAENDEPLYSRYDTDERKVLLHFFGQ